MTPRLAIGVMGSASGTHEAEVLARCNALGRTIAERGCTLITGACPGLSYAAVEGARTAGGLIVGISPGLSRDEHVGASRYGGELVRSSRRRDHVASETGCQSLRQSRCHTRVCHRDGQSLWRSCLLTSVVART